MTRTRTAVPRAFVRACARGERPPGVPPGVAAILTRHAPVARVMTDFYRGFRLEGGQTPYPADELGGLITW